MCASCPWNPASIPYSLWGLTTSWFSCSSAGPAQSGILTDREVVSLFLHFTVNPKPRVEFIDRPRCCLRGKECSISRFQQVESRWGYSGTSDRIRSASLLILLLIDWCLLSFQPTLDLNLQGYVLDPNSATWTLMPNHKGKVFCWAEASPDALTCMCSCRLPLCFCIGKGLQQLWPLSTGLLVDLSLSFSNGFLQLYGHVAVGHQAAHSLLLCLGMLTNHCSIRSVPCCILSVNVVRWSPLILPVWGRD